MEFKSGLKELKCFVVDDMTTARVISVFEEDFCERKWRSLPQQDERTRERMHSV